MKVLCGIYPHGSYDGEIILPVKRCGNHIRDTERKGIAIIHQELALVKHLTFWRIFSWRGNLPLWSPGL
jgi:D-xylose transport system ATP-binding protein